MRAPTLERRDLLRHRSRRQLLGQCSLQDLELGQLVGLAIEQLGLLQRAQVVADRVPPHAQLAGDDARALSLAVKADQVL